MTTGIPPSFPKGLPFGSILGGAKADAGGEGDTATPVAAPVPDSGLLCLASIAGHYRIAAEPEQLGHELGLGERVATSDDLVRAGQRLGLRARQIRNVAVKRLRSVPMPCILGRQDGSFVLLVARAPDGTMRIADVAAKSGGEATPADVSAWWNGTIILVTRRAFGAGANPATFNFRWFLPSIWRYRSALVHVLLASLIIQVFALITPMFFQIVIDKVLVHKGYATLLVVTLGLIGIGLFDVVMQYLRTYALSHTTSRIDVELGARLFDHLMRLPLGYFETRSAGQTVARIRELETIRHFLTGQGLTSVLDLAFAIIFIIVLFLYSPTLALVVCASIPCYIAVAFLVLPVLRVRIEEKFNRGAESQQFLVETVVGVQTLKAAAVEPVLRNQWEEKLAAYVKTAFVTVMIGSIGQGAIQYISKVTTAVVLFLGAYAVINGELTVGSLVAFNMIMNQVTGPILRLSQLWQDFQQVQVSVERLGDILNAPTESRSLAQAHLPPAKGAIKVEELTFRYRQDGAEILRNVSLDIPVGQVIGIVGPSGSGKSTLTKLMQRLYSPERGQILVDGIDIAQVDPAWLRRQIGVVLQENMLFNRTIHENIALANPGMARAAVINAARLAGADEFINKLPLGYDTMIEERGANLSGGQRQRIAIARALANNPRILILDEATSALDYESERIIQQNMRQIVKGRTVVIIAHRLVAVRDADRIIAMDNGQIVEDGNHLQLINRADSLYGRLWRMQSDGAKT
jgi:ATP-binding cassette, subfamily B, bacterial HlyB/CyaB